MLKNCISPEDVADVTMTEFVVKHSSLVKTQSPLMKMVIE